MANKTFAGGANSFQIKKGFFDAPNTPLKQKQ
jgi:hypothetical protein